MSQRAYSKIENNDIKLDWGRIEDISKILKIEPAFLVSFDDSFVFNNHFSSELKKSYETLIDHLEKEVLFLRRLLEQS